MANPDAVVLHIGDDFRPRTASQATTPTGRRGTVATKEQGYQGKNWLTPKVNSGIDCLLTVRLGHDFRSLLADARIPRRQVALPIVARGESASPKHDTTRSLVN